MSAFQLFHNPGAAPPAGTYGAVESAVLNEPGMRAARSVIATWPGYEPTPLVPLDALAAELGLANIWFKDESTRFGLNSFKALGGAYAVFCLLKREIERSRRTQDEITADDLIAENHASVTKRITVTCATDGNHGRAVAWGAKLFGCRAVIFVHETVSEGRAAAIARYGAEVIRVPGNYDDSVRHAAATARKNGWFVISDTSYPGYMDVPRDVMHGYMVMADEATHQLPLGTVPTHVFVQAGVGGLAAAVCATNWLRWGAKRPRFIVVEPTKADCLYRSAVARMPTVVTGDLDTIMAGLSCGEVSLLAWNLLKSGANDFLTIPDDEARRAMRKLATHKPPIVAGESGVAGLAGLLAVCDARETRHALGLTHNSRVLLFGSEGATDPAIYAQIVGRSAAEVAAA
jgi:diaminopropionate ammonia-lyase